MTTLIPSPTSKPAKQTRTKKRAKSVSRTPADSVVSLRWDLAELPSSQHKAGLAGLALCVEFLRRRADRKGICELETIDSNGLTLRVDRAGMQSLFDDVYAASRQKEERSKKLQKKGRDGSKIDIEPEQLEQKQVLDDKGNAETRTVYIYEQCIPRGDLVNEWDSVPQGDQKLWLNLWRDFVWTTLRGKPASRGVYKKRDEGKQVTDGARAWDELVTNPRSTIDLTGTYYLGAQEKSAENTPFLDIARMRFLLHFWPFIASIYVPAILKRDDSCEFVGFVVAIPDVANLEEFVANCDKLARERSSDIYLGKVNKKGTRPRDAVIDVAAEAGLDVARRAFAVLGDKEGTASTSHYLTAVDVFHIERKKDNVLIRGIGRVDLVRNRVADYARVRKKYRTPLFRRRRIINILEGRDWWCGFGRIVATSPEYHTIGNRKFRRDCRTALTEVEMREPSSEDEKTLDHLIYQATRTYVRRRLEYKHHLKWDSTQSENWKKEYREKKEKVARDAFLAVRSRMGADFVAYFTGTICSIPQRLNERAFLEVARALHDEQQIERIRSLTLLALSANA